MPSNDFILLFLIGIAIYCLIKQDDMKPIKNTGSLEKNKYSFKNSINEDEMPNNNTYSMNERIVTEVDQEYSPTSTINKNTNLLNNTMDIQYENVNDTPMYDINATDKQMYNINATDKQTYDINANDESMYDNKPMYEEPVVKQKSNNINIPNTFGPDEINNGANLLTAFNKPLPEGTKTNAIDFNKNYLKSYDSKNYLPQEVNDEWFDTDFSQAKNNIENGNLINTDKYVIGVDTVGQSLKNASWDLRGTIVNPKFNVSPWNNSTYEADYNIKPLC